MASNSKTVTLVAATAQTVTLTNEGPYIAVTNLSTGTDIVFARVDGTNPATDGDESYPIMPGKTEWFNTNYSPNSISVRVISAGTPKVNVRAANKRREF